MSGNQFSEINTLSSILSKFLWPENEKKNIFMHNIFHRNYSFEHQIMQNNCFMLNMQVKDVKIYLKEIPCIDHNWLKDFVSSTRAIITMCIKNYADNPEQSIDICTKFSINLLIFAPDSDVQADIHTHS